jgi:exonuclease III
MKIATWNVNSLTVRLPQVIDWLKAQEALGEGQAIDVLALQELKMTETEILRSDKRCSLLACFSHPLGLCVFLALIY